MNSAALSRDQLGFRGMAKLRLRGSNGRAIKVEFVAAFADDVPVELDRTFTFGISNKTPEFLRLNPRGKVCSTSWRHPPQRLLHASGQLPSIRWLCLVEPTVCQPQSCSISTARELKSPHHCWRSSPRQLPLADTTGGV